MLFPHLFVLFVCLYSAINYLDDKEIKPLLRKLVGVTLSGHFALM